MKATPNNGSTVTVAMLLERRLTELECSAADLADAAQVPTEYIDDLIAGRRLPPHPSRTDIYPRMTSFLKLGRSELENSAHTEREGLREMEAVLPAPAVRRLLLGLCNPETARQLGKKGKAAKDTCARLMRRLLNVAQAEVRRVLLDPTALRVAAERSGRTSRDVRFTVLEFLDTNMSGLTTDQVERFVRPRIVEWDADPEHGTLKVVLRSQ